MNGDVRIELAGVCQQYRDRKRGQPTLVLRDVNLSFTGNGINVVLGPSGSGKSTILRLIGGLRPPDVSDFPTSGTVTVNGKMGLEAKGESVTVFQEYLNRKDLSVFENVAFPFRFRQWKEKVAPEDRVERTRKALEQVGLSDKAELFPFQLSGGQNQRIALARAFVLQPRILLLDEPFGALDDATRRQMRELLQSALEIHPCCVVFVTHDVDEALLLADRIVVLSSLPLPVSVKEDFRINEPRPRTHTWLEGDQAKVFRKKITTGSGA